jgi:Kef-type K+ transport system membrane component KefB
MEIFLELSLLLAVAAGVSILMRLLKQPLIVGYILTGIIVGPSVLDIFKAQHEVELFSKIGITVLLFIVGLHLSPNVVKELGKVSLTMGIAQIVLTTLVGFLIAMFLGLDRIAALYTSIALTFSSTIIIIKLLTDKRDLNKLYGKIAIGLLLVQDIVATIILILISSESGMTGGPDAIFINIVLTLGKGIAIIALLLTITHYLLPRVYTYLAKSQELLFLVSLAWGLGLASLFHILGFSVEIGALVAGVALASTPYAYEIGSRMKPIRDFFVVLFFVLLGSHIVLNDIGPLLVPTAVLSLFVLIGNPLIVIIIMNWLGYGRRTGFMAGLVAGQVSEFSLILATIGFEMGHLERDVLSLITLVGLVCITGSSYMIMHSDRLFKLAEPYLRFLEFKIPTAESARSKKEFGGILFGYGRIGADFVKAFRDLGKPFVVVDYNPAAIAKMQQDDVPYLFGDVADPEFLEEVNLHEIALCVSTVPEYDANLMLVKKIRAENKKAIVILYSYDGHEAKELYDAGATFVVVPHYLSARYTTNMIGRLGLDRKEYEEEREKHLNYLAKRYGWERG